MTSETKRSLTYEEIEDILLFLKPNKHIPYATGISIMENIKKDMRKQLSSQKIYPSQIVKLKEQIEYYYHKTIISPGTSVGVIGAQSIGEKQTQTTLNSFHTSGMNKKVLTIGVPKIDELLNATKDPKNLTCLVYFNGSNSSIKELRKSIGTSIVSLTINKIKKTVRIMNLNNEIIPSWYKSCELLYKTKGYQSFSKVFLSFTINTDILYEYKIMLNTIVNIIEREYEDLYCLFSPLNMGRIDIFVNEDDINLPENICFVNHENKVSIYLEEVVQPILLKLQLCGIQGIEDIYYIKDKNNKWMVETDGSNYKQLLGHPLVDDIRTISSNMWDIYNTLGIEATRQFLIDDFLSMMTGINKCHIELLVEKMTFSGIITSISRYTMRMEDNGPISRASFEETMDNFIKAGLFGQHEKTVGVSASIICGKVSHIGTGYCDLLMDWNKVPTVV